MKNPTYLKIWDFQDVQRFSKIWKRLKLLQRIPSKYDGFLRKSGPKTSIRNEVAFRSKEMKINVDEFQLNTVRINNFTLL